MNKIKLDRSKLPKEMLMDNQTREELLRLLNKPTEDELFKEWWNASLKDYPEVLRQVAKVAWMARAELIK